MTSSNITGNNPPGRMISAIIKTGLLAGTLDICAAFLYSYIKRSVSPQTVLQYICKVAFGKDGFTDPSAQTIIGLLVHFSIAMGWTILFFIIYRALKLAALNRILTGILYGLFVWTMMNVLILPWWNNKPFVFNAESSTINALILILAIGMPLSFMAYSYFSKRTNQ
jgi:hypothetical protein